MQYSPEVVKAEVSYRAHRAHDEVVGHAVRWPRRRRSGGATPARRR